MSYLTAHGDVLVEAPSSRGAHHKIKPAAVLDHNKYKTGVDRSDQMLSYYSFGKKSVKWWEKLFFHLFDLVVVNSPILRNKTSKKKMSLKIFYENVARGLLTSASTEIQVQGQASSPASRLVGRDNFLYRIPVTHAKLEGESRCSCRVCAERSKRQTGNTVKKCTTMHTNKFVKRHTVASALCVVILRLFLQKTRKHVFRKKAMVVSNSAKRHPLL